MGEFPFFKGRGALKGLVHDCMSLTAIGIMQVQFNRLLLTVIIHVSTSNPPVSALILKVSPLWGFGGKAETAYGHDLLYAHILIGIVLTQDNKQ